MLGHFTMVTRLFVSPHCGAAMVDLQCGSWESMLGSTWLPSVAGCMMWLLFESAHQAGIAMHKTASGNVMNRTGLWEWSYLQLHPQPHHLLKVPL